MSAFPRRRCRETLLHVTPDVLTDLGITPLDARDRLIELEGERLAARDEGVISIEAYRLDLEEEIELWRSLYALSAVTEIATLRAELFGAQTG